MHTYNFENLEVWKLSLKINTKVSKLTKKLPPDEKYVLASQMNRASLSICLNIAEGSGRGSKKDFKRFIRTAVGSSLEVIACIKISIQQNYLSEHECEPVELLLKELYFKLIKLEKYLKG